MTDELALTALLELAEEAHGNGNDWKHWVQPRMAIITSALARQPAAIGKEAAEQTVAGWKLAMRVLQSNLYSQLDDAERAECDALVRANPYIAAPLDTGESKTAIRLVGWLVRGEKTHLYFDAPNKPGFVVINGDDPVVSMEPHYAPAAPYVAQDDPTDYEAIEREHLGDEEKRTGIYATKVEQDERVAFKEFRAALCRFGDANTPMSIADRVMILSNATFLLDEYVRASSAVSATPSVEQDERGAFDLPPLPDPIRTFADHSCRAYSRQQMIDYARAASTSANVAQGAEAVEFEWPPLPALPNQSFYAFDRALFTEHQMQGYANAYGEAVRVALTAAPPAQGKLP